MLSLVVAGGALVMYMVSCPVDLPGFEMMLVSLIVAALFIALFLLVVITRG